MCKREEGTEQSTTPNVRDIDRGIKEVTDYCCGDSRAETIVEPVPE